MQQQTFEQWISNIDNSWINDWNDILRDVIFKDDILKKLMKLPEGTKITDFRDRFFIKAGYTNKLLSNESVRIVYGSYGLPTNTDNVSRNEMSFDIYVKLEDLNNIGRDRLICRTQLIAKRLKELLTDKRYNGVYRFYDCHESDMGTTAIGYARYNISFEYMRAG